MNFIYNKEQIEKILLTDQRMEVVKEFSELKTFMESILRDTWKTLQIKPLKDLPKGKRVYYKGMQTGQDQKNFKLFSFKVWVECAFNDNYKPEHLERDIKEFMEQKKLTNRIKKLFSILLKRNSKK